MVDLVSGETSAERLPAGGQAILTLARGASGGGRLALPELRPEMDYFAASLLLLAKLACAERLPR
jgi:hypothetical protein